MSAVNADIPLSNLIVSSHNTRVDLNAGQEDSGIDELAASIQARGLLQPITVRKVSENVYEVVMGQRRLLACQKINYDPVPCIIRDDLDDTDVVTVSLVENVHRADMDPLDKARALKSLFERHKSIEKVAKETSWSSQTIRRYLSLLDLPIEIQRRISTSQGPAGIGALSKLAATFSGEEAVEAYEKISGFTQNIQSEILKRTQGDISKLDNLVDEAMEGAFDIRHCGGRNCEIIREMVLGEIGETEFEDLVKNVTDGVNSEFKEADVRAAARRFWKTLASGA